jgi:hypothetical protein
MLILKIPVTPFWYQLHAVATSRWIVVVNDFATVAETVRAPTGRGNLGGPPRHRGADDVLSVR